MRSENGKFYSLKACVNGGQWESEAEPGNCLFRFSNRKAAPMREINPNETGKLYDCLEALAKYHNQVSVHFKGDYPQIPSEQKTARFRKELEEGRSRIAVAENDHKVIGFCKINTDGSRGVLEYLVVLDQERGKGYGAAFMDWALNAFRELGMNEIDVKAAYGNEAIRFYEKYGFREKSVILTLKR